VRKAKSLEFNDFALTPGEFNWVASAENDAFDRIAYGYGKSIIGAVFDLLHVLW